MMTLSSSIDEVFQLCGDSCHKSFDCIKTGLPGNMIAYLIPIIQLNFNVTEAENTHLSRSTVKDLQRPEVEFLAVLNTLGAKKGINLQDVQKNSISVQH